jgi:chemotaxis methyl-accepting protein methylase
VILSYSSSNRKAYIIRIFLLFMAENIWRLTGFNRHPSLIDKLRKDVLPIVSANRPLSVATIPCSTGAEALSITIALDKEKVDYHISGFDVDEKAILASRRSQYFISSSSGQIIGDPYSGYEYNWSNLSSDDRYRYFEELKVGGRILLSSKLDKSNFDFNLQGVEDVPNNTYNIIFCLNFLKYLTDERFSSNLPSLGFVTDKLFSSNKNIGALLIDPTSSKVKSIRDSLVSSGYLDSKDGFYLKC